MNSNTQKRRLLEAVYTTVFSGESELLFAFAWLPVCNGNGICVPENGTKMGF